MPPSTSHTRPQRAADQRNTEGALREWSCYFFSCFGALEGRTSGKLFKQPGRGLNHGQLSQ